MQRNSKDNITMIGWLMIAGSLGVFIPYTILTLTFDYPAILREHADIILTEFNKGGLPLIFTWLAFAMMGLPLLIVYSMIGKLMEEKFPIVRWATTIGIISGMSQIIGLLRWVFVVPVLASDFVNTTSVARKQAIEVAFYLIHQFAGVLIGEHIGQLFTVIWTLLISTALYKARLITNWLRLIGLISSFIYLFAQLELLKTVIPDFPVIPLAGFAGSTLWLLWLVLVGIHFIRIKDIITTQSNLNNR